MPQNIKIPDQAGKRAVKTGKRLESFIKQALEENGYRFVHRKDFRVDLFLKQPIYSSQVNICKSIYGSDYNCDFILYHPEKWPDCLVIESKWQQRSGSVDEKFPYIIENIEKQFPYKAILLVDGGGFKKGAVDWIRKKVGKKLIGVCNMAEFQKWVNNGHL
jgi:hypothetical protein